MKIKDDIYYVGVNDRVKHRFEGLWLLPAGVSYNAYIIADEEKVALIDTVDCNFFAEFLDNIHEAIGDRKIDYLVINHMEPDHSGSIALIRKYYPEIKLVGNKKTFEMVEGFYGEPTADDVLIKEGETLSLGKRTLRFHLVPMLHWPETMVTYDMNDGIIFSGDAFGCFGALDGAVIDTQMDVNRYWSEMERYYAAILGGYARPVQSALKKLAGLEINMICSTHGPVWTENAGKAIDLYRRLSSQETEQGLVICYGSMYGNSQRVAEAVAQGAAEAGLKKIIVHNLSVTQPSFVLADIFRYKGLAVGGPTYNGGLFPVVGDLMDRISHRDVQKHVLGWFGGCAWAPAVNKCITEYNEKIKMEVVAEPLEWKFGARPEVIERGRALGRALAEAVMKAE